MDTRVWIYFGFILFVILLPGNDCNTIFVDTGQELNDYDLDGDYCLKSWSCVSGGNVSAEVLMDLREKNCQCDKFCGLYGDCCPNMESETKNKIGRSSDLLECHYLPEIQEIFYTYVIRSCPTAANGNIKKLCKSNSDSDLTLQTPVTGTKSGFLYGNMYCAICNLENYEYWVPGMDCGWRHRYTGNISFPELEKNSNCKLKFYPPSLDVKPRPCFPVVNECSSDNLNNACVSGNYTLVFGEKIYRNKDCAECNGEINNLTCNAGSKGLFKPPVKKWGINYSYRLLIDINTNLETRTGERRGRLESKSEEDHSAKCTDNEIYDPFSESCREIFCKFPFVLNNSKCFMPEIDIPAHRQRTNKNSDNLIDRNQLVCPKVKLNQSEYQIINESGKLLILSSAQTIEKEHFFLDGLFAFVCINYTRDFIGGPRIESLLLEFSSENILSLSGVILSLIALLIGLIIYIRFKKLQNIPGKNLICLMSALFFGQLFFLIAPAFDKEKEFCTAVAIIIHLTFLSSFFWMNIMAFDICFTFTKSFLRSGDRGKSTKRFYMYLAYGWLTPFCIVLISVSLDQTNSDFGAGYGKGLCWISNQKGLLVFFLVPLFVLIFANIIMFILTSRSIYISDKSSSRILEKKDKCKLFIYIKLCIVMGLTWISGFVATLSNVEALWYVFIIFNSLQGVFIFLAFVCNKKVLNLIRGRMRSKTFNSKTTSAENKLSKSTKSTRTVVSTLSRNSESTM